MILQGPEAKLWQSRWPFQFLHDADKWGLGCPAECITVNVTVGQSLVTRCERMVPLAALLAKFGLLLFVQYSPLSPVSLPSLFVFLIRAHTPPITRPS